MQGNEAYDLNMFAPKEEKTELHVAEPTKKENKLRRHFKWLKWTSFAVVFVALVCSLLYAQVESTELSAQMHKQEDELADLQSEYTYLSNEMEMKTNLSAVQQYATGTLKMVKMDPSQVTYVTSKEDNQVERPNTGLARLAGEVSQTLASFMEYLAP